MSLLTFLFGIKRLEWCYHYLTSSFLTCRTLKFASEFQDPNLACGLFMVLRLFFGLSFVFPLPPLIACSILPQTHFKLTARAASLYIINFWSENYSINSFIIFHSILFPFTILIICLTYLAHTGRTFAKQAIVKKELVVYICEYWGMNFWCSTWQFLVC